MNDNVSDGPQIIFLTQSGLIDFSENLTSVQKTIQFPNLLKVQLFLFVLLAGVGQHLQTIVLDFKWYKKNKMVN